MARGDSHVGWGTDCAIARSSTCTSLESGVRPDETRAMADLMPY